MFSNVLLQVVEKAVILLDKDTFFLVLLVLTANIC